MGNGCFCKVGIYKKDINLDSEPLKPITNTKSEHIEENKLNMLINYFNEKERVNEMRKSEMSKNLKKRSKKNFNTIINNKHYEIMLKRLSDQKIVKRLGPKRRQTIRKEDDISNVKDIVKEILQENKDNIHNIINQQNQNSDTKSSLIIKNNAFKNTISLFFDRNGIMKNLIDKTKNN